MTGEQKPGGLEGEGLSATYRFAYESIRKGAPGLSDMTCAAIARSINMKVSVAAEPAEVRIRELEARAKEDDLKFRRLIDATGQAEMRATAAEAKLARAVERLEAARDHFDFLTRMASGSAVFEIVDGKRIRRKLGEVIASEADEGSKHVRQTLAALQQEGE